MKLRMVPYPHIQMKEKVDNPKMLKNVANNRYTRTEGISDYQNTRILSLTRQLRDYPKLENDWDGYGGVPPKQQTVEEVVSFLSKLPDSVSLPKPMLGGEGVVGLYWDKQNTYADVCFEGNGTFWYYARDEKGNEIGADDISVSMEIPRQLLDVFPKSRKDRIYTDTPRIDFKKRIVDTVYNLIIPTPNTRIPNISNHNFYIRHGL